MEASDLRFASLLGHDKPKALLREAVAKNKMGHAYLFRGPDGVGKKRTALTLAAYINCKSPLDGDSCGRCTTCRKYFSGNHPDLILVEPDGAAIKIGQIRELKHQLTFPPLEAKVRVIVLEDIHTMRREAANSLLKTLEEPAPGNLLILTADLAGDVLPTILSRCQIISFGSLDHKDMAQVLMQENDMEESLAFTLAAVAEGSLGRAKLLWQEGLLSLRQEVVEGLLLGQQNPAETIAQVFRLSEKGAALKENTSELLALIRLWYRDLVLVAAGGPEASIANKDLALFLPAAAQLWSLRQLQQKLHRLDLAERQLLRNCSRTLVLETLFFDLI
ncbi:MAG: DNA polymerase III subunit delta' [Desulfobulbaceae bacterium]|nr:MAG: DNA polymerase III subunit delta' [Desulfobulbaceae bacterium]